MKTEVEVEARQLETRTEWDEQRKCWVCSFCKEPHERLYVVTGHDHTDYEIDFCKCRRR